MKLITIDDLDKNNFIPLLRDKEITVYEDIQGSPIWVKWNGGEWEIRPKHTSAEPISMIDLTSQKFYNHVYMYLSCLSDTVFGLLNRNWQFGFEYFPDQQPANISYDRLPKNSLILTCIYKGGKRYISNTDELKEYSSLFETDMLPIIFKGVLNQKQLIALNYFVHTSEKDLEYVFGEKTFAEFFYKILNPAYANSFLMNVGTFQENLEKVIIKIDKDEISFKLLNPLYKKISNATDTDFTDVYSLILVNFLQFCQTILFDNITASGVTFSECYIDLMCRLYNLYMSKTANDLINFQFVIPPFFGQDKFKINKSLIDNKTTLDWIGKSTKLEYIFKILLSDFRTEKKKPVGIFTERTLVTFNSLVKKIRDKINETLKYRSELDVYSKTLLNFDDFANRIKVDTDGEGKVYPPSKDTFASKTINTKKKLTKKPKS